MAMRLRYTFSKCSVLIWLVALVMVFGSTACKKDKLLTSGGEVQFSVDTLTFDTVFSAVGSFTCSLTIRNPQNQKIVISSLRLENANSNFHININGIAGNSQSNIEIAANDSIYVFATVNIDPRNANTPYLVTDKLIATVNGKDFSLPLLAFGQDAHYIVNEYLQTQTWKTDKPYVIINSAGVDSNQTLTIPAGCRIYMNENSRFVVKGTLKVMGTATDSVVFQGNRLDRAYYGYEGYPGEWGGIYFDSYTLDNEMNYTVLRNCGNSALGAVPAAIQLSPDLIIDPNPYQLVMRHCTIENSIGYGIIGFQGSLRAENCLIHSCGAQALALVQGGTYDILNCTFALYTTTSTATNRTKVEHLQEPAVAILNFFDLGNGTYLASDLKANLTNCLIWGSLEDELYVDKVDGYGFDLKMDHCLVKSKEGIPSYVNSIGNKVNEDPLFADVTGTDFHVQAGSPAIDAGVMAPGIVDDRHGEPRPQGSGFDIGCYEQ
jgi:hypothetical protein